MQKITPFLWFKNQAEEAANFYISIFEDSKILNIVRFGASGPGTPGQVMTVEFELRGQQFVALNDGPEFNFTPAISFYVHCKTQEEVDYYWQKLTEGGFEDPCGWLRDKYGVSWQIVPDRLMELLQDTDAVRAQRVMGVMMQMKKIDIQALEDAYKG